VSRSGALEAVERVLNRGGDPTEVLRATVAVLHERLDRFVRVSFVAGDRLEPGPAAGDEAPVSAFPIVWEGMRAAELEVSGELQAADRELLGRVATLVSPYVRPAPGEGATRPPSTPD
jgi:hypothetical protein